MNIRTLLSIVIATTISTSVAQTSQPISSVDAESFRFDEVTYTPEKTTFKLFAPFGGKAFPKVQLHIYKDAS